jgi:hypothetical protein
MPNKIPPPNFSGSPRVPNVKRRARACLGTPCLLARTTSTNIHRYLSNQLALFGASVRHRWPGLPLSPTQSSGPQPCDPKGLKTHIPVRRRNIRGRPFGVGFECSPQPYRKEHPLLWIAPSISGWMCTRKRSVRR